MKKVFGLLFVGLLILVMAGPAAASYTFEFGSGSTFTGAALSDPGLAMSATVNDLDGYTFTLNDGGSWTGEFATIGTTEHVINPDDIIAREITAWVDFDDPDLTAAIGGSSVGFQGWFIATFSGWEITWYDPVDLNFGAGTISLDLADLTYWNIGGDPSGCKKLDLTVTYHEASQVPVPAAVWLLGSGLVGLAGLRRKFRA